MKFELPPEISSANGERFEHPSIASDLKSTPVSERIAIIDIWRGFALLGVVVVNFCSRNEEFLTSAMSKSLVSAGLDWRVNVVVAHLMGNKFHTLFSFLFGVGFAIIIERAARGAFDPKRVLLRRMLILLAIGWLHFLGLFSGEEIHVYALCGLILLACHRLTNGTLLTVGLLLAFFPRLMLEEWPFFQHAFSLPPVPPPVWFADLGNADVKFRLLHSDDSVSYVALNFGIAMHNLSSWSTSGTYFLYFLGRVLIGFVAWRAGWLRNFLMIPTDRLAKCVIFTGIASALITSAAFTDCLGERGSLGHVAYNAIRQAGFFVVVAFYVSTLTWLHRIGSLGRLLMPLALLGRMSLTAYLTQSVFLMVLLAGPGLALAGRIGASTAALLALAVYVAQLFASGAWSRHFGHGPVEWIWRRLTYTGLRD
jgi:uncharacterized protein